MVDYNIFPEGKNAAVTFSYDDGVLQDKRLIEIFNKYGMKATFHLNSGLTHNQGRIPADEIKETYKGFEIACHTVHHPSIAHMPTPSAINEVIDDRRGLEGLCGYPVRGMSYPNGSVSDEVVSLMKSCGIVYSRTTVDGNYKLPEDFMRWNPTCHHRDAKEKAEQFLNLIVKPGWRFGLLYIWGHSYEFDQNLPNNSFEHIEEVCKMLSGFDNVWYATNIEIYEYVMAQRSLYMTVDEKVITNPSNIDVWVNRNGRKEKIPAGQTVIFE